MALSGGVKTSINDLKEIVIKYKEQMRRLKIVDVDNYPIVLNIKNETCEEDEWEFEDN